MLVLRSGNPRPGQPRRTRFIGSMSKSLPSIDMSRRRAAKVVADAKRYWRLRAGFQTGGCGGRAEDAEFFGWNSTPARWCSSSRPPFDPNLFRFNEGTCDATGRFWIGVMFDPLNRNCAPQASSLHNFTLGDGLRSQPDVAELHNGMAWSGDGSRFYLSHSNQGEVFAYSFDPETGGLGARALFAQVPKALGIPDGAAVDSDGGYWCAVHGGGRLRRYTAAGELDRDIFLPISQPTMCAFAGKHLDILCHKRLGQADYAATSERTPCWRAIAASSRREGHSPALLRSVTSTC